MSKIHGYSSKRDSDKIRGYAIKGGGALKIDETKQIIVGIIDSYGYVDSCVSYLNNIKSHSDLYPSNIFKRWTWWGNSGIEVSPISSEFDVEDFDKVEQHLQRKYGILTK